MLPAGKSQKFVEQMTMTNNAVAAPSGASTQADDNLGFKPQVNAGRGKLFGDIIDFLAVVNFVLVFLFLSGFFRAVLTTGPALASELAMEDRQSGNAVYQVMTFAFYTPSIVFLLAKLHRVALVLRNGWPYVLLVGLALVSILWSVDPELSTRRGMALLLSALYVLHVVTWFDTRRLLRLFAILCATMMIASAFAIAVPGLGITPADAGSHVGRWRGVFSDKNYFGVFAGLSILTFVAMRLTSVKGSRERQVWTGLAIMSLVQLYFANSRTPLIGVFAAFALMWVALFLFAPTAAHRKIGAGLRSMIVSVGMFVVTVVLPTATLVILPLLGRDLTLSGRVKLWEYGLEKGMDRLWIGAGYRSFWIDELTFDLILRQRYWGVEGQATRLTSTGHNGFLDIWLELGIVGLIIMIVLFLTILVRSSKFLYVTKDPTFLWYVGIFAYTLVYYMTHGFILKHDDIPWFVVAYAIMSLAAVRVTYPAH